MMGISVVFLFSFVACSSQVSRPVQHLVSCDAFMNDRHISDDMEITVDDSLTIGLCSNPTAGFQWPDLAEITDQTVLKQAGHEY